MQRTSIRNPIHRILSRDNVSTVVRVVKCGMIAIHRTTRAAIVSKKVTVMVAWTYLFYYRYVRHYSFLSVIVPPSGFEPPLIDVRSVFDYPVADGGIKLPKDSPYPSYRIRSNSVRRVIRYPHWGMREVGRGEAEIWTLNSLWSLHFQCRGVPVTFVPHHNKVCRQPDSNQPHMSKSSHSFIRPSCAIHILLMQYIKSTRCDYLRSHNTLLWYQFFIVLTSYWHTKCIFHSAISAYFSMNSTVRLVGVEPTKVFTR